MKVAFVHDWLATYTGAEKVLEAMLQHYPDAPIYTLVYKPEVFKGTQIEQHPIHTSFIEKLPKGRTKYRSYLAFMPLAIEQFDLSKYDIVISSSSAVAKGVITGPNQLHISYVHTPIRYAWDLQHQYLREAGLEKGIKSWLARWILHKIRLWDVRTIYGVNEFVANSQFIARRIRKVYGRESTVIYPPVNVDAYPLKEQKENFFVTASRLVPYKKIDLIVQAFSQMPEKRLVVIGDGPGFKKLQKNASSNVELMGYQSDEVLLDKMQRACAFVFAAEEDFGIAPLEAQACGTPVIAFGKGAALETIRGVENDTPTGVFFYEQNIEAIHQAVQKFESDADHKISPLACRENALRFSPERFHEQFKAFVDKAWVEFQQNQSVECK